MKKLLLGNAAVAQGAYEAGVKFVSSYPGTPSTEITEAISKYPENEVYAEWAPNEKVAAEAAIGAGIAGARAMSCCKHVGLNVMADPLFTDSYIGANGGIVFCVADDPGMHSSQNEQDSRHYAKAAKVPMLEPSDSQECKDYTKLAFQLSEDYDTPVIVRLSTRVSHSQSLVEIGERQECELKEYKKDITKNVMMPAMAIKRHVFVEERTEKLKDFAETSEVNTIEDNKRKVGVICGGVSYQYAKEALGDQVNYLKLGMVYPLPESLFKTFDGICEEIYVVEQLDPYLEEACKVFGLKVHGKECFTLQGEYTPSMIAKVVLGKEPAEVDTQEKALPNRPPVLCAGCPHRATFHVLSKLGLTVSGDIGCYTLGALAPLNSIDTTICMGASVSAAHGMSIARGKEFSKNLVSVIGDSTFMHSGITGLSDMVYNQSTGTVIILDNSITGMTGHQENPTTGKTIRGKEAPQVNLVKLCEGLGVKNVRVVNAFDTEELEKAVKEETAREEVSVIISQSPCVLLKGQPKKKPCTVTGGCMECGQCMTIGCPAISLNDEGKVTIDETQCNGCGLCQGVCPFEAIETVE